MSEMPSLETKRLLLRPFSPGDASRVQLLAGTPGIAEMTLNIPHPYEDGMAEEWIETHPESYRKQEQLILAITLKSDRLLIGAIGLVITRQHQRAELGYWIGEEFWGQGYCTEAGRSMLDYGFRQVGLNRIYANHFSRNPASGRVMQKIGMQHEGCLRQHVLKEGRFEDLECYAVTGDQYSQDA